MSRLILLLAASALASSPALAQHQHHHPPAPAAKKKPAPKKPAAKKPAPKKPAAKKPAAKKPVAKKPVAKKPAPKKPAAKKPAADPHAGHQMPAEQPTTDPHAGHQMPAEQPAADPHAGHQTPAQTASDPHAGHDMSATRIDVPVGPPPAEALQGPEHAADLAWGRAAMEGSRAVLFREHGDMPAYKLLVDRLEARSRGGRDGYLVDAEGWYGGDIDKLWLKGEFEGSFGERAEQAELQVLWSHAIDPWFDVQTGVRLDARPDRRARLVAGIQGLAPYWIEVDAAAFLSDRGDVTARAEAEHDVRITRRLIAQPRAELDFSLQDIPRERVGAGLSTAELGLRLRYEIEPQFAPYVGIEYERAFGETRRFLRADGEDPGGWSLVAGVRTWF